MQRSAKENAMPLGPVNRPTQIDGSRFGYKKKKSEAVANMSTSIFVDSHTEDPVDLLKIYDTEIGDLEVVHAALSLKPVSSRYEFKDQIEELKGFMNPHRTALKDVKDRQTSLRQALKEEQDAVNRRLDSFDSKTAEKDRLHQADLANEREKHAKEARSWKAKEEKTEQERKQAEENKDIMFAERVRQKQLVHNERVTELQNQVELANAQGKQRLEDAAQSHDKVTAELQQQIQAAKQEGESHLGEASRKHAEAVLTLEQQIQAAKDSGTQKLKEMAEAHELAIAQVEKHMERVKDDCKDQLAEKAKLLQTQISNSERSMNDAQKASKESQEKLVAEWTVKVEDLQRREQELRSQHEASLAETECNAELQQSELKADHAATLAKATAASQSREEELLSQLKSQQESSQKEQEEMRINHGKMVEFERVRASQSAETMTSQLKDCQAELARSDSTCKRFQTELSSAREQMKSQEQDLGLQLKKLSSLKEVLEEKLSTEKQGRSQEALVHAALVAEHATTLKHAEEQRQTSSELQSNFATEQNAHKELHVEFCTLEAEAHRLREALAEQQATEQKRREELEHLTANYTKTREDLVAVQAEATASRRTCERLTEEKRDLELAFTGFKEHNTTSNQVQITAITDLKVQVEKLTEKFDGCQEEIAHKANDIVAHQLSMKKLEDQLAQAELSRRELHNTIQELKGNIRVMCRVRPGDNTPCALQQDADTKLSLSHGKEVYPYSFDHVFGTQSSQEDTFAEVSGLVQSALDGYKVCIFAYGQTGSGKTYTMQGRDSPESWGLIPRSLRQIFNSAETMRAKGWQWTLKASFIEVYNEVLRDLLREDTKDANATPQCHTIKHDADWGTVVTNVGCVEVSEMTHINALMAKAAKLRAVGSTDMNSQSSRSHSIFALYLTGINKELNVQLHGALHLVDLAGSERLDKSGAVGDRLKETQNINKSLSSLADVFTAKAENRSHVPFRNSKLTHLMEPCLSGQGKTLMFVNVGPEANNSHETKCSLMFAQQVSQCTTGGKPKRSAKTPARPASAAASSSCGPAGGKRR